MSNTTTQQHEDELGRNWMERAEDEAWEKAPTNAVACQFCNFPAAPSSNGPFGMCRQCAASFKKSLRRTA